MSVTQRKYLAWLLFAIWLLAVLAGFWYFQFGQLTTFTADKQQWIDFRQALTVELQSSRLRPQPAQGAVAVIHFWDDSCPCSRFSNEHLLRVIHKYSSDNKIEFYLKPTASGGTNSVTLKKLQHGQKNVHSADTLFNGWVPPAIPAVVVLDGRGELAYFGPYSSDAVCGSQQSFFDSLLEEIIDGKAPQQTILAAYGCFCTTP